LCRNDEQKSGVIFNPSCARIVFMNRDEIIGKLKACEADLRARGVAHAALFGSRARGDNRPDSDIDIMVEIAPEFPMGVFEYIGVVHAIEDLFPVRVDVSNRIAQKPHVRPSVERDAVYAF
jgi:predicted nucleotidyltransferase